MSEKEMPEENKTMFYMIKTIDVLVENQKILLSRIKRLEDTLDEIAEQFYDDTDEDRIIN
jgi:hypothetical protein